MNPVTSMKPTNLAQSQNLSRRNPHPVFIAAVTLALLLVGGTSAWAQSPTPTPSEEEIRLQGEKRVIELQKDIELAKKAIRDAQPQPAEPKATPLDGNTTVNEGLRLEAEMVSYKAMSEVANVITKEIRSRVVRVGRTSMSVLANVYAEHIASGVRRHTNECWLTFVHLDEEGNPAPVPPLLLETDEDRRMNEIAVRRREQLLGEPA